MEQRQLHLVTLVFFLHVLLGETHKITGSFETPDHSQEESNSLVFKRDLSDTLQSEARTADARDSSDLQRQGLLGGLLGGGSPSGSTESSGGGGLLGGLLGGGGGGILGTIQGLLRSLGLGGVVDLISGLLGGRSHMTREQLKKILMQECGNECNSRISGLKTTFRRNKGIDNAGDGEVPNLESEVFNGMDESGGSGGNLRWMVRSRVKRQLVSALNSGEKSEGDITANDRIQKDSLSDKEKTLVRSPIDQELDGKDILHTEEKTNAHGEEDTKKMNFENGLDATVDDDYYKLDVVEDRKPGDEDNESGFEFSETNSAENDESELKHTDYKDTQSEISNSEKNTMDNIGSSDTYSTDDEERSEIGSSEEYDNGENDGYKESGSLADLDSNTDDSAAADDDDNILENYHEKDDEDKIDDGFEGTKDSSEPEVSAEEMMNSKDVSSSELPTYLDYNFIEYDFRREGPQSSYSKGNFEESKSMQTASIRPANTHKGKGYPSYYNLRDMYRAVFERMYWPFMYRKHPQPFNFNRGWKVNHPMAEARQIQIPYQYQYPSAMAGSDLYKTYATAYSRPIGGLGLGEGEGEGLGEENLGFGQVQPLGAFGKR